MTDDRDPQDCKYASYVDAYDYETGSFAEWFNCEHPEGEGGTCEVMLYSDGTCPGFVRRSR